MFSDPPPRYLNTRIVKDSCELVIGGKRYDEAAVLELLADREALTAQVEAMRSAMNNACNVTNLAESGDQANAIYMMESVLRKTPQQCLLDVQAEAGRKGYAQALFDQFAGDYQTLDKLKFKPDQYAESVRQGGE